MLLLTKLTLNLIDKTNGKGIVMMFAFEGLRKTDRTLEIVLVLAKNKKQVREMMRETELREIDCWQVADERYIREVIANSFCHCRFHVPKLAGFHYYNTCLPLQDIQRQKTGTGNKPDMLIA